MHRGTLPKRARHTLFSQVLLDKRTKAGLTLADLAELTLLPIGLLEALEVECEEIPSFDVCYKIGQAINSRRMQGFMIQDLWQAASMDRMARHNGSFYAAKSPASTVQRQAA